MIYGMKRMIVQVQVNYCPSATTVTVEDYSLLILDDDDDML